MLTPWQNGGLEFDMKNRVEEAEKLFKDGYNCSQSVFEAFSDLYGMNQDMALRLSASFGGGLGRMREVCGAVSGMGMIVGLETGTSRKMDDEGKKYNYDVVQRLSNEFKVQNGSIICRELLGLDGMNNGDTTPQKRKEQYYHSRPCEQLVKDAAAILEQALYTVDIVPVVTTQQIQEVAELAEKIWHEHYDSIISKAQVDYMVDKFQSEAAMKEQMQSSGYQYYKLVNLGGIAGYFAIKEEQEALFLSKLYVDKKYRGRDYARKALSFMQQYCIDRNLKKIWLTVNRNNDNSIHVYDKLGFVNAGTQIADIGSGFVMDDYIMEKFIP
ncbi:MAG TPA: C-GCAxxG-C-C family (seleno)protein [Mobilitalea sp.]|nr:C-GCAxxG-C-C family (seleno)protein [Mobilitalea sp.]